MLVHFERWSHRYDEWIYWDSNRLRPLERPALRKEGLKDDEEFVVSVTCILFLTHFGKLSYLISCIKSVQHEMFKSSLDKNLKVQNINTVCLKQDFKPGEEVLARWTDCRYYPAKIEAINKEGMYSFLVHW